MSRASKHWKELPLVLGDRLDGKGTVDLPAEARQTHTYIAGASGTGKTKLLESLIRQDIFDWPRHRCGLLLLDPDGVLFKDIMRAIASHRHVDWPIVPIDMSNPDYVVSYNPLRQDHRDPAMVTRGFVDAMAYAWGEIGTNQTPLFENWALELLLALHQTELTLAEAPQMMSRHNASFRRQLLPLLSGSALDHWEWACTLPRREFSDESGSTIRRMKRFETSNRLSLMLGTGGTSFDFRTALDEGWIVLVNLSSEGGFGDPKDADTLATLMLSDLWMAAADRGKDSAQTKRPFRVYIDEFQRFITPTIAENLARARGFGLHLTLATQFPRQLLIKGEVGQSIYENVMANVETMIVFGMRESGSLQALGEWLFRGVLDPDQIKHEIYSTKVMGQEITTLHGRSITDTDSHASAETETVDEYGNILTVSTDDRHSGGTSVSDNEMEAFKNIFGIELSSREYRSLEEQLFKYMQKLFLQDKRCAFMRTASMRGPVPMRTRTIRQGLALDPYVKQRKNQILDQMPFVYRSERAVAMIQERLKVLQERIESITQESASAGRVVKSVSSKKSGRRSLGQ